VSARHKRARTHRFAPTVLEIMGKIFLIESLVACSAQVEEYGRKLKISPRKKEDNG
jgi:hypothetical protein